MVLRQGHKEFLKLSAGDLFALTVVDALTDPVGDEFEAGAIDGFRCGGQLRDDLDAGPLIFDHGDHAIKLTAGPAQASEDVGANFVIDLHAA